MRLLYIMVVVLLLQGCASLPAQVALPESHAFDHPAETWLGQQALAAAALHAGHSGFLILDTGQQAFLRRAELIEAAERSIDAQYYIWNSDVSGRYLARRLLLAADRGVLVRLLLDDINVRGRDAAIAALDQHPNIEIRIFNPSAVRKGPGKGLAFAGSFRRLNRRMHNKTFVADAALGIAGGRNIGDEYFDLHPRMNFRDRDVLAMGPVVRGMSANFDAYWNSAWSYPISRLASATLTEQDYAVQSAQARTAAADTTGLTQAPVQEGAAARVAVLQALETATWALAELVFDPPPQDMNAATDQPKQAAQALRRLVDAADSEILIESAYFILGASQLDSLAEVRARGVRVAALTNSLASNDLVTNHGGYAHRRPAMLAQGLELYELRPDAAVCRELITATDHCDKGGLALHAKSAVFDRSTLYVGSFNINLRSIYLNGETVLIIHSPELAQRVAADIEKDMAPENSWQVRRDADGHLRWSSSEVKVWSREPDTGWWRRFKSGLFSLLPIEKYL